MNLTIVDKFMMCLGLAVLVFVLGLSFGMGIGYNEGYKDGFDKALPLTYATTKK